jgi:hypothetical protein
MTTPNLASKLFAKTVLTLVLVTAGVVIFLPKISLANTLDSWNPTSNTSTRSLKGTNSPTNAITFVGFLYKPGASHNVCSFVIDMYTNGTPTDAVRLNVYNGIDVNNRAMPSTGLPRGGLYKFEQGNLAGAATSIQVRGGSLQHIEFDFNPCLVVVGNNFYDFEFSRTGSYDNTNYYIFPNGTGGTVTGTGTSFIDVDVSNGQFHNCTTSTSCVDPNGAQEKFYVTINGTENFSAILPNDDTQTSCTPPSNILDVGGGISYSLCYLFIPNQKALNDFGGVYTQLQSKVPFAYFYDIKSDIEALGSSSDTFPSLTLNLSTTALPMNVNIFSEDTVTQYAGSTNVSLFRTIMSGAIYILFGLMVWKTINNLIHS